MKQQRANAHFFRKSVTWLRLRSAGIRTMSWVHPVATIAVLLLAGELRLFALEADAPLYLSLYQGLSNDGATTISPARDMVVFDSWSPPWHMTNLYDSFPTVSWLTFPLFQLLGVGYWQANYVSVMFGLLTIALIACFARHHFGRGPAFFSALFLATNYPFVAYNRTPIIYTFLSCILAFSLVLWGLGLRKRVWFLASLVIAVFSIFLIKLPAVSFAAAGSFGLLVVANRRIAFRRKIRVWPLVLFVAIVSIVAISLSVLILPNWQATIRHLVTQSLGRTLTAAESPTEAMRFLVQGIVQFGVYSSLFARMPLLFLLSFGFLFYRGAQLLSGERPALPLAELMALLYLGTTGLMLMFSRSQATRYLILLVPPMSLVGGIALWRWFQADRLRLPRRFGRLYPAYIQLGAAYLIYQVLAAALKVLSAARLSTGFGDYRTILTVRVLYMILAISLLASSGITLWFLRRIVKQKAYTFALPSLSVRVLVLIGIVLAIVLGDCYQYLQWARDPQYTIVRASRELEEVVGPQAIIGGDYAYPLALENGLRAFYFTPPGLATARARQLLHKTEFTHLAIGQDGSLLNGTDMKEPLERYYPGLLSQLRLVKTYRLRDNVVHIYEYQR